MAYVVLARLGADLGGHWFNSSIPGHLKVIKIAFNTIEVIAWGNQSLQTIGKHCKRVLQ